MGGEAAYVGTPGNGVAEDRRSPRSDLKREHEYSVEDIEQEANPSKKQAKEASNEDIKSEITNPLASPTENTSSFKDISSQPVHLDKNDPEGGGEAAACSGDSDSEETLSDDGERRRSDACQNDASETQKSADLSQSQIVLEIPKHLSSTGIRKITFKFSKRKEEHEKPVVEEPDRGTGEYISNASIMGLKLSKKVVPCNYPSNVKKLLSTGILEGARVKYISNPPARELEGIIRAGGYLCGCATCNFSKVLSAYEFEQHAGAKTRHPNNHIYLENGRPIYSIIQELKTAPLDILSEVIRNVAGSSVNEECFQFWKASFQHSSKLEEAYTKHNIEDSSYHSLVSCSVEESYSPSSWAFSKSEPFMETMYMTDTYEAQKKLIKKSYSSVTTLHQKRTAEAGAKRRDNDLHRLLFMPNGLPDGTELAYYVKGQKLLGGYKQGNGIVCSCCDREISPSQFESHAGMAARRQPYRHIYTSTGLTLHDIAMSLASGHSITTGGSDDMCTVCGDGGDLLLCNGCPRAYHPACLNLQSRPEGTWYCSNCKDNCTPGRKASGGEYLSNTRPIVIRLTRVVKAPESEIGGCAVCRAHDFSAGKFDDRTVILCDQCEKEYHVGCLRERGLCDLKEIPRDKWFCCDDCNRIHEALQRSISSGLQLVPASFTDIIARKRREKGLFIDIAEESVEWRMLNGKSRYPEHLPLLSKAAAIFRECFDPIVAKSGRDLIPVMVYGRNISGQEFGGMYCVVLMVKSFVVSAGLLRIFGREAAELPLVATSRDHQGKGYFQVLFSCIENLLISLNVENLVLPAAEEAESIWTNKFGFSKMSEAQLLKYQRELQLTVFKGTSMLEKKIQRTL